MSSVRPFKRGDIIEVADLYKDVFLHDQDTDIDDLRSYFDRVYFDHPCFDEDCPSLVYCGPKGEITAFIGVMPSPMRFRNETIKAAITGNLMIKGARFAAENEPSSRPMHGNPIAPAAMIKTLFKGPYDLLLSDTAIEASRRIWEHSGGHAVRLYSLRWLRVLKPCSLGLNLLSRRDRLRPWLPVARPFTTMVDRAVRPFVVSEAKPLPDDCVIEQIRPEDMVDELSTSRLYDILPDYSLDRMAWILKMARSRRRHGPLKCIAVRQTTGRLLGWALYAGKAGAIGKVLQLYADPRKADPFFDGLFHEAANDGLSALSGKVDPLFIKPLSNRGCILRANAWTLAWSKRPELIQAFLTGKALFSELESEGWTRFSSARSIREFAPA